MTINNLTQKVLQCCNKNQKETVAKLKESSNNPLMHIRNNNTSSSENDDSNSSDAASDLRNDHGILDSGSKVSKSIAFGPLTTISAEMMQGPPRSRAGSGSR
jgi:hypothetical protein